MNEKELFKKAIEENLVEKENIRNRVIATVKSNNKKEAPFMKRRLVTALISIIVIGIGSVSAYAAVEAYEYNQAEEFLGEIGVEASDLSRSDAKRVYKDIKSDAFENTTTLDILNDRAQELGMEEIPTAGKEIYDAIVNYHGLVVTGEITSEQIRKIEAGMTYKEIVQYLGATKDIGSGLHVLQYAVDGDKIFYLSFASEEDICNSSGEELLKTLEDAKQDYSNENTFNGTVTQRMDNSILVSCPTYDKFDVINLSMTDTTTIFFEDGTPATIEDIQGDLTITIEDGIRESYPPQGTAREIIIRKK